MKKILLLLSMMCVSILPFKTWKVFIPEHQEQKKEITYSGYGSKLAKVLYYQYKLHPYEVCIVMTETGGVVPKNYNFGNLRRIDLRYHNYKSFDKGLFAFRELIDNKYRKLFSNSPKHTFQKIQPIYAPDGGQVWVNRCLFWYKLLFDESS